MSEIYDLNIAITALTNAIGDLEESLSLYGVRDTIHDLTDAIEEQNESMQLRDFNMIEEHIPLTNKSYEQTLLGGLMLDNSKFDVVLERVNACHFEEQKDNNIFSAMKRLHKKGKPIDTLSVLEELNCNDYKPAEKYLFDLAKDTAAEAIPHLPTIANIILLNSHDRMRGKK